MPDWSLSNTLGWPDKMLHFDTRLAATSGIMHPTCKLAAFSPPGACGRAAAGEERGDSALQLPGEAGKGGGDSEDAELGGKQEQHFGYINWSLERSLALDPKLQASYTVVFPMIHGPSAAA